jgi:hypothetical protein
MIHFSGVHLSQGIEAAAFSGPLNHNQITRIENVRIFSLSLEICIGGIVPDGIRKESVFFGDAGDALALLYFVLNRH